MTEYTEYLVHVDPLAASMLAPGTLVQLELGAFPAVRGRVESSYLSDDGNLTMKLTSGLIYGGHQVWVVLDDIAPPRLVPDRRDAIAPAVGWVRRLVEWINRRLTR